MVKRTFREALLFYRDQFGLTQSDMADKLSLKLRYYQKLEGGESEEPSVTTLLKVLDGLSVTFEEFFKRPAPKSKPAAIRPQSEPKWPELARLVRYYGESELESRLLSLYILSENPDYIDQYAKIDGEHADDAAVLKRILSTS